MSGKVEVRVIERGGESVLVEWYGELPGDKQDARQPNRVYVPLDELDEGKVSPLALDNGIPYGVPWAVAAERIIGEDAALHLEARLRLRGIWGRQEFEVKQQAVWRSLDEVTNILGALSAFAHKWEE